MATKTVTEPQPELTSTFQGRTMRIKTPTPEQLAMFQQTLRMIKGMSGQKNLSGERAMKFFDQGSRVVLSLLADSDDKEWLRDQFFEGDLGLSEAFGIVQDAIDSMNNQKAPTTGPVAKKAAARRTKK